MTQRPTLPPLAALTAPSLSWNAASPYSEAFGDVYFSKENGRAETEHVFIHANRLPERFSHWLETRPFVIGETGFGTGLNMLCAWACFECHAPKQARLHLLSTEKYPLIRAELAQALEAWPELASHAASLLTQWPAAVSGIHRLHLTDRVTLDLHFGDTCERLALLDGQVDAWFLDGFAPSKNPDMWQPELFHSMAARSRPGATFATFTCAGIVKRGLKAAGFHWQKVPGFGRKREMLAGQIDTPPLDGRRQQTPWFTPPAAQPAAHIVVIGAGIAGASVAAALAKRGLRVSVIEKQAIGAGGSGNQQGALYVKLAAQTNDQSRVYFSGLLYSRRWLENLDPAHQLWHNSGVIQLALSAKEAQRQQRFLDAHQLPDSVLKAENSDSLGDVIGMDATAESALFYPQAGWVKPRKLCEQLLSQPGIIYRQGEVIRLEESSQGWLIHLTNGETVEAEQVVVANAQLANHFEQTRELPLQAVRGQVSSLNLPENVEGPRSVVCAGGYVPPAVDGVLTFGASFVPNNTTTEVLDQDHLGNIEELRRTLPALATALEKAGVDLTPKNLDGRAAVRAASPDKSPYAGPVPKAEAWQQDYALLRKDATRIPALAGQHYPGLWISAAHGSRGLASAPLCAEVIASRICDEPMPLEAPLVDHLHPGRRIISTLIRAQ
ncbi:MAG: bifunctional tRNA (5-methylaminomethyl-2-thiouridine)(34)-methyltransferase MnmD/FAD-dependent 5-carboxymethylaminomethyl-2-thiouridine(34) oxidoreductase MnmC [Pseudomonadota bacterium]